MAVFGFMHDPSSCFLTPPGNAVSTNTGALAATLKEQGHLGVRSQKSVLESLGGNTRFHPNLAVYATLDNYVRDSLKFDSRLFWSTSVKQRRNLSTCKRLIPKKVLFNNTAEGSMVVVARSPGMFHIVVPTARQPCCTEVDHYSSLLD